MARAADDAAMSEAAVTASLRSAEYVSPVHHRYRSAPLVHLGVHRRSSCIFPVTQLPVTPTPTPTPSPLPVG